MFSAIIQFLICATCIVVAGTILTNSADVIAHRLRLGRLVGGLIFLAIATSLPELSVDLSAVRLGNPDLAAGDLLGSSLMNLLILGLLDLMHRSRGRMLSYSSAAHALSGTMSIALTALAALAILTSGKLSSYSFAGIGVGAWLIVLVFVLSMRLVFFDQKVSSAKLGVAIEHDIEKRQSLLRAILEYVGCAAIIFVAGPFLASAASVIADQSGLGDTFVGSTFIAFCTSLPELITSVSAVRMGAFDMAVGNLYGSNAFNMVIFAPLDAAQSGSIFAQISPSHLMTCLATIIITTVAIAGQLYQVEKRKHLIEPDALTVVLLVLVALAGLYFVR